MSDTKKIYVPTSNRFIFRIVLGVLLVLVMSCMLPLYLQNRMDSLYEVTHKLSEQVTLLQRDALQLELKIHQLSSLERLSGFADSVGLSLNGLPVKVMVMEGRHE